jgi:uncharacterized protein YjbI with pentapeptide repeats
MSKYQVVRELGCNREGGRITYLTTDTSVEPPQQVVIKEFRFATTDANWSGFKAYEREIEILQQLEHPRIPRYLDSYETQSGFCLVQEYKNAPSLAESRSFYLEDIKKIAVSVLEILVYLQQQVPPVIHRDIKPENILVDSQVNAYLVDFGFARFRGGELAMSSVAAGTPGFMPPEEQFGRTLTEASDLYSLGATLICLLTGTRSVDVGNLIDDNYRFDFKTLVPQLSPSFIWWLEKMVAPNVKQRYANAADALEALQPIRVVGGATSVKSLAGVIKGRKLAAFLGLATLVIAGVGTTLMIFRQVSPVTYLLVTKQCQECNLEGANLEGASLEGADLWRANLGRANLKYASLKSANLGGANLRGAQIQDADLGRANLAYTNSERAIFAYTNLRRANLEDANLRGASLRNADLRGADLRGAKLRGANLKGTDLRNANLSDIRRDDDPFPVPLGKGADLRGANLEDADLKSANLEGANLEGAKLRGANLEGAKLRGAIMPDGRQHE